MRNKGEIFTHPVVKGADLGNEIAQTVAYVMKSNNLSHWCRDAGGTTSPP